MERQSENESKELNNMKLHSNSSIHTAAEFEKEMKNWLVERANTVAEMKKELEPLLEFEDLFNRLANPDSDIGESSVFYCYVCNVSDDTSKHHPLPPPDSEVHDVKVGGKKVRVAIWDAAGGSRTISKKLLSSYQKQADGILMVYDVTRRDTFTNICDLVAEDSDFFSSKFKMVVGVLGRKGIEIDDERGSNCKRQVTREELSKFGEEIQCLITECAWCEKSNRSFRLCLEDLVSKVLHDRMLKADDQIGPGGRRGPVGARLCKVFKCITEKLFSVGKQ